MNEFLTIPSFFFFDLLSLFDEVSRIDKGCLHVEAITWSQNHCLCNVQFGQIDNLWKIYCELLSCSFVHWYRILSGGLGERSSSVRYYFFQVFFDLNVVSL